MCGNTEWSVTVSMEPGRMTVINTSTNQQRKINNFVKLFPNEQISCLLIHIYAFCLPQFVSSLHKIPEM